MKGLLLVACTGKQHHGNDDCGTSLCVKAGVAGIEQPVQGGTPCRGRLGKVE